MVKRGSTQLEEARKRQAGQLYHKGSPKVSQKIDEPLEGKAALNRLGLKRISLSKDRVKREKLEVK